MSEVRWLKVRFRDDEVLARVDAGGAFVANAHGLVAFCYKPGGKEYKSRAASFGRIDGESPKAGAASAGRSVAPSKGTSKGRGGGKVRALTLTDCREGVAVQLWTDGACSFNPGPAGAGVFYDGPDGRQRDLSVWLGEGTNNIAELTAILEGIRMLESPELPVDIITDSTYCIGLLSQGWKPKKNQALVAELKEAFNQLTDVRLIKVKGHAGVDGNERADELARRAVELRASQDSGWRA